MRPSPYRPVTRPSRLRWSSRAQFSILRTESAALPVAPPLLYSAPATCRPGVPYSRTPAAPAAPSAATVRAGRAGRFSCAVSACRAVRVGRAGRCRDGRDGPRRSLPRWPCLPAPAPQYVSGSPRQCKSQTYHIVSQGAVTWTSERWSNRHSTVPMTTCGVTVTGVTVTPPFRFRWWSYCHSTVPMVE